MLVSDIRVLTSDMTYEVQATVSANALKESFTVWYRFPITLQSDLGADNGDMWLAALLPLAMRLGEEVTIEAPVSQRLMRAVRQIQTYYLSSDPSLAEVAVEAPVIEQDLEHRNRSTRVGLFFSLGVDSFYSLLKRRNSLGEPQEKLPQLILVHGFDIFVGRANSQLFAKVLANARMVARTLGTEVLPVSTNLRDLSDYFVDWGLYFGAAMASVGLALQSLFGVVLVASGRVLAYARVEPWGSSPDLDPLWSTEHLTFVHHGCEASRLDKIRLITQFPIVLETLRVYWENRNNEYNCCRCEKCLRTMVGLYVAGALSDCKTFRRPMDLQLLRHLGIHPRTIKEVQEVIGALGSGPFEVAVKSALMESLANQ